MKLALHIWLSLVLATSVFAADDHEPPAAPPLATEGRETSSEPGGVPERIRQTVLRSTQVPLDANAIQMMAGLANAASTGRIVGDPESERVAGLVVESFYDRLAPIIKKGLNHQATIPAQAAHLAAMVGLLPVCWGDSAQQKAESEPYIGKPIEQVSGQAILLYEDAADGFPLKFPDCKTAAPSDGEKELFKLIARHIEARLANGQPPTNINNPIDGNPGAPPGQDFVQGEQGPNGPTGGQPEGNAPGEAGEGPGGGGSGGGGSGGGSGSGAGAGGGGSGGGAQYQSKAEKMEAMKVEQPQPTQPMGFQGLSVPEATLNEQMLSQMQIPQADPEKTDARKAQMDGFIEELTKMRTQAIQAAIQLSQAYQANLPGPVQTGSQLQFSNVNPLLGNYADRIRAVGSAANVRSQGVTTPYVAGTGRSRTLPSAMGSGMMATTPNPRSLATPGRGIAPRRTYLPVVKRAR